MRIACLLIPDLPLHAALRAEPELAEQTLVIMSGPGPRAQVLTVSPRARAEGLFPGMTLPQARSLARHLVTRIASPSLDRATRDTLLDIALSISPRAELASRGGGAFASEGVVFADASGIEALYGKPENGNTRNDNEQTFASVFQTRAERAGIPGVVAVASSRSIARLVARHLAYRPSARLPSLRRLPSDHTPSPPEETLQVLSPEQETRFLAPLPIDLLDPDDATAEALTRFGIHQVGELLRLSRRDLAARLGPGILSLIAKARGEATERPLPEPRNDRLEEGIDLEAPIAHLEALAFVLRGLSSRLLERLRLRSLGCAELHLDLQLENGARRRMRIGLAAPTQDERVLLRLLRLAVEATPPQAPIEAVSLRAEGLPQHREQLDFFLPRGPSPNDLEQTLAELCALCGSGRVGAPALAEDHRPDGFTLEPFRPKAIEGPPRSRPISSQKRRHRLQNDLQSSEGVAPKSPPKALQESPAPHLSLRALRPPLLAEVRLQRGRPASLHSAISRGPILRAAGPWRTTGLWWSETGHFAVDHYDIQMGDGAILRLCFDWKAKRWQIDGLYD